MIKQIRDYIITKKNEKIFIIIGKNHFDFITKKLKCGVNVKNGAYSID